MSSDHARRRRLPPLVALRAFEATARHLSATAAADELAVTQSAISRQLGQLEALLGLRLFDRLHRGLALTPAGESLARTLADCFDRIAATVAALAGDPARLELKAPPTLVTRWLMPRLKRFEAQQPGIDLQVVTQWNCSDITRDMVDAGIIYAAAPPAGLPHLLLFPELLMPVAAPGTVPALDRAVLLHPNTDRLDWRRWADATGHGALDLERGHIFDTFDAAVRAAEGGHGIAMADVNLIGDDLGLGRLVAVAEPPVPSGFSYWLVWRPAVAERPALKQFRDWIAAESASAAQVGQGHPGR
ncbi:MAG: LysR substrate-binding domain-containing protein [Ferrovibrionaceae bacterium]